MLTLSGSPGSLYAAVFCCWAAVAIAGALRRRGSGWLSPIGLGIGSGLLLFTAVVGRNHVMTLPMPWFLAAAPFQFSADPLSRWFLGIIGIVGIAAAIFSPDYLHHLRKRVDLGFVWSALALLMISMSMVVLSTNALVFLVAWELMALSSFALVASDHEQRSVQRAALVYLGATRAGTAFLMVGFLWAHHLTGSWNFGDWHLSGGSAVGPALLIFIGLAVKAGCWPFHLWLPIAHPAAPAPVSAVMSGVMIKTAIYAMVRLLVMGHLDCSALGPVVLILGAISAFWGVLFALLQHDLKRLLAYHSVENIGIILMGLGLSMIGNSLHQPLLAQLGLASALFHTLNHALFKSLLFLGAGVVDARAHTRDVEQLGGLIHKMPWTAGSFIVGSAAICALPPLNGFVSEWLLYKGFFGLAQHGAGVGGRLCGLLLMGWLAMIGAMAVACFVKAVGVVFLGLTRSEQADHAREGTRGMVVAQVLLAVICAGLGIAASFVLLPLGSVVAFVQGKPSSLGGTWTLPIPMLVILLAFTLGALAVWMSALSRSKPSRRFITWECGFGDLGPRMQYTASSFAQPIARMFRAVNRYTVQVDVDGAGRKHFPDGVSAESEYEPYLQTRVYTPLLRLINDGAGGFLAKLQAGSIHQYLSYMMVALGLLLFLGYHQ
ncbi:MAG: proton-conducting transporter transmembrane domain-containing protein [Armatimonadota bacterium]